MRSTELPQPGADSEPRFVRLAPLLLAGAGAVGSVLLLGSLRRGEVEAARADFDHEAMARIAGVRQELTSSVEQLYSTVALFDSSDEVQLDEFLTFTSGGLDRHASLRAIYWIETSDRSMRMCGLTRLSACLTKQR